MSKSFSEMSLEELWQLFPIILKEYNPEYKNNLNGYTEAKTEFIKKYTTKARKEFRKKYLPDAK
ncbi:hypothetical protein [Halanaerobium praevalens]|uniref:Uncharacterized protein n=1 Tax=Halanaerobium praevalens (strain ATCC 33744 / DSM 2228 / GSL) TaxID=572479 RepID=E3DQC5_HALPG|nr:hypothetical protein [Halanaerobium praevalens]ADO77902.1 hypothetical protein Hprae_1777 [Halanaerobium praevalens DSM 2228]